jgi:8-oxo-dGTP diphosphatase
MMICTRLLASAFLFNGNDLLLMRRSDQAKFLPGMWAPVGGHLEAGEFCTPQVACEREIAEETGLSAQDICDFTLRYIVHRIHQGEIRIQYCYFGTTMKRDFGTTDEGELHWIPWENISTLAVSATTRFTLEHYAKIGSHTNVIFVASMSAKDGNPTMLWSPLSDWE